MLSSDSNVRYRSVEAGLLDPGTSSIGYKMRLPSALKDRVDMGVMTAAGYGVISLSMSLLNKIIMTKFFFDYPIVIMMMQMALTLFVMEVLRVCNVVKLLPYTFDRGKDMFVPSLLYALHGYFSLTALEGMNLPMYGAVKRFVPLLTMWMSYAVLRKQRPSREIVLCVILLSIGAFLAAVYDFTFDIWSYVYGILALIFQATYLTMIEKMSMSNTYSPVEMMYMNAFNCLVFFLIADLVQDEIRDAFMYLMTSASAIFVFSFLCLMALGFVLNYAMFMCIAVNSALTTCVIGNVKAALQTFVGYYMSVYLFYDIIPNLINALGLIMTLGAFAAFSYYKLVEQQRNPKQVIPTGRL